MKINDFTKSEQLLMFIYIECGVNGFSLKCHSNDVINYGIAKSKNGVSSLLSELKRKHYLTNSACNNWIMTKAGELYAATCVEDLDDDGWFSEQPEENEEIEQPNNFADDALQYANIAKDIASKILKQYGVNTDTDEIAKLQKENDKLKYDLHKINEAYKYVEAKRDALVNELNNATGIIENLRHTNRSILEKLDIKTKECEKLQFGLDNIKTTCQNLAVWIDNIKIGQGI